MLVRGMAGVIVIVMVLLLILVVLIPVLVAEASFGRHGS